MPRAAATNGSHFFYYLLEILWMLHNYHKGMLCWIHVHFRYHATGAPCLDLHLCDVCVRLCVMVCVCAHKHSGVSVIRKKYCSRTTALGPSVHPQ